MARVMTANQWDSLIYRDYGETIATVGEVFEPPVTSESIAAHEMRVNELDRAVKAWDASLATPENAAFLGEWSAYVITWEAWRDDAKTDIIKWESRRVEFATLKASYNLLLDEFSRLSGQSPPAPEAPPTERSTSPLAGLGDILSLALPIVVIGAAVYFLGPVLVPIAAAIGNRIKSDEPTTARETPND